MFLAGIQKLSWIPANYTAALARPLIMAVGASSTARVSLGSRPGARSYRVSGVISWTVTNPFYFDTVTERLTMPTIDNVNE